MNWNLAIYGNPDLKFYPARIGVVFNARDGQPVAEEYKYSGLLTKVCLSSSVSLCGNSWIIISYLASSWLSFLEVDHHVLISMSSFSWLWQQISELIKKSMCWFDSKIKLVDWSINYRYMRDKKMLHIFTLGICNKEVGMS